MFKKYWHVQIHYSSYILIHHQPNQTDRTKLPKLDTKYPDVVNLHRIHSYNFMDEFGM